MLDCARSCALVCTLVRVSLVVCLRLCALVASAVRTHSQGAAIHDPCLSAARRAPPRASAASRALNALVLQPTDVLLTRDAHHRLVRVVRARRAGALRVSHSLYLEFGDVSQAQQALGQLSGRTFDGRTVKGSFVEPAEYDAKFRPLAA